MKQINKLITITIFIATLLSCANPLMKDPRLYNKKNGLIKEDLGNLIPPSANEESGPEDASFEEDAWFNNENCNNDATKENTIEFPASEFNDLFLHAKFLKDNIPEYKIIKKEGVSWKKENDFVYTDTSHGNTTAYALGKNQPIQGVEIIQYRGVNPANKEAKYHKPHTFQQKKPLMDRFYFYRFKGMAPANTKLDNYLIAIDTYSKFIFAFAEPDKNKLGFMDAPCPAADGGWLPIDSVKLKFFAYAPVGYVTKSNDSNYEVILYDWFKNNLASGNYKGIIYPPNGNKNIASKTPDGSGMSPFFYDTNSYKPLKENVARKEFGYRASDGYTGNDGKGYGLQKFTYSFDAEGNYVTVIIDNWNGSTSKTENIKIHYFDNDKTKGLIYLNDKEYSLKIDEKNILHINKDLALENFTEKDPGPSFENRLLGARSFAKGNKSAILSTSSENIDTLKWSETITIWPFSPTTTTYTYTKINPTPDQSRDYLIYKNKLGTLFYKVQIQGKGTTNDPICIRMSNIGQTWGAVNGDTNMTEWLAQVTN